MKLRGFFLIFWSVNGALALPWTVHPCDDFDLGFYDYPEDADYCCSLFPNYDPINPYNPMKTYPQLQFRYRALFRVGQ